MADENPLRVIGRTCGDCTLCCKLLAIPVISKKQNEWCQHCSIGKGCGIYEERPQPCRDFECLWLQSDMPEEMRPDRIKAVFGGTKEGDASVVYIDARTPDHWRHGMLGRVIERMRTGFPVIIVSGKKRTLLLPDGSRRDALVDPSVKD